MCAQVIEGTEELAKTAETVALSDPMLREKFSGIFGPLVHKAYEKCLKGGLFANDDEAGVSRTTVVTETCWRDEVTGELVLDENTHVQTRIKPSHLAIDPKGVLA